MPLCLITCHNSVCGCNSLYQLLLISLLRICLSTLLRYCLACLLLFSFSFSNDLTTWLILVNSARRALTVAKEACHTTSAIFYFALPLVPTDASTETRAQEVARKLKCGSMHRFVSQHCLRLPFCKCRLSSWAIDLEVEVGLIFPVSLNNSKWVFQLLPCLAECSLCLRVVCWEEKQEEGCEKGKEEDETVHRMP